jgi:hypothetical protein
VELNTSPGSDQVPSEPIQAGGGILQSAIHKLINFVWNKEELPDQWKESIIVPIHKKGDKPDCNNYHEISLLSTAYRILSNIVLSRDRLCGLVVRVLGYRSGGPGSIPGTTRKKSSASGMGSIQTREYN